MAPVILKGSSIPRFNGFDISGVKVMAYNAQQHAYHPIPFQYDEFTDEGSWMYAANGAVDDADEIVFMAKDAGDQIIADNFWPADQQAQANRRYEITVLDPYTNEFGFVYIFYSSTLPYNPTSYISYTNDTIESDVYKLGHDPEIAAGLPTDLLIKGNDIDILDSWRVRAYFKQIKIAVDAPVVGRVTVTGTDLFFSEELDDTYNFRNTTIFYNNNVKVKAFQGAAPIFKAGPIRVLRADPFAISFNPESVASDTANIYFHTVYYPNFSEFYPEFNIDLQSLDISITSDWIAFSKAFNSNAMQMKYYGDDFVNSSGVQDSLINHTGDGKTSSSCLYKRIIGVPEWPGTHWTGFSGQSSSAVNNVSLMTIYNLNGDRLAPNRDPAFYFWDYMSASHEQQTRDAYGVNGLRIYDWSTGYSSSFALDARIRTFYYQRNMTRSQMQQEYDANVQELQTSDFYAEYVDSVAPADINDLTVVNETDTSVTLTWTAPGDDGILTGPAKFYLIRYSTADPDTFNNIWIWWNDALQVPSSVAPTPIAPGMTQIFTLTGLQDTALYFRMRAGDDATPPNYSALSNIAATYQTTVPVELAAFNAIVTDEIVNLHWETASETNNLGFEIQRSVDKNNWEKIGYVKGAGTTNKEQRYQFTDAPQVGEWYYRLRQIDTDGTATLSSNIVAKVNAPNEFALAQNYPNPFNPSTTIAYQIPDGVEGQLSIIIYDLLGRQVVELVNGQTEPGSFKIQWNGMDAMGSIVGSGVYILRMQAPGFNQTRKMVKIQ